jgi:hypothetical protein
VLRKRYSRVRWLPSTALLIVTQSQRPVERRPWHKVKHMGHLVTIGYFRYLCREHAKSTVFYLFITSGQSPPRQKSPSLIRPLVNMEEKAIVVPNTTHIIRFWGIFVAFCLLSFIFALDVAIITTSVSTITADIGGATEYVWIANSFVVASLDLPLSSMRFSMTICISSIQSLFKTSFGMGEHMDSPAKCISCATRFLPRHGR